MIWMLLSLLQPTFAEEAQHITSHLTLKVQKREYIMGQLIEEAQKMGGYYASRTDDSLRLKIPVARAEEYVDFAVQQGLLADRSFASRSLHQDISDLEARLKTREELLQKYFDILAEAGSENVIAVENEVIRLVTEIETIKGQLRRKQHLTTFADISIHFQFRDRRAPVSDGSSSFEWINHLNLVDVVTAFEWDQNSGTRKATGIAPEGFAIYPTGKDLKAASSDGLLYRVRIEQPSPQADDAFWAEAVSNRMSDAGYHSYNAEHSISSQAIGSGQMIKCLAPNGEEDWAYWIAFVTQGKRIKVVEVVGEASLFRTQEEAIKAAIEASLQ